MGPLDFYFTKRKVDEKICASETECLGSPLNHYGRSGFWYNYFTDTEVKDEGCADHVICQLFYSSLLFCGVWTVIE